jgi:hypothetical protein
MAVHDPAPGTQQHAPSNCSPSDMTYKLYRSRTICFLPLVLKDLGHDCCHPRLRMSRRRGSNIIHPDHHYSPLNQVRQHQHHRRHHHDHGDRPHTTTGLDQLVVAAFLTVVRTATTVATAAPVRSRSSGGGQCSGGMVRAIMFTAPHAFCVISPVRRPCRHLDPACRRIIHRRCRPGRT